MRAPVAVGVAVAAIFVAATSRAAAAPGDYELSNAEWNGLSTFAAVGRGVGLDVEAVGHLRWDELEANDAVLLIYPTLSIEASRVIAFARRGGRVVVADDFGAGANMLARIGLLRERAGPLEGAARYQQLEFAPIAEPLVEHHPLAEGVQSLVTNHPAVFSDASELRRVFGFPSGEVLVAAGELGDGEIVALADPSVLINRMLELEGNLQFAINLLRELHRDGRTERLVVVTGDVRASGRPPPRESEPGIEHAIARALDAVDDAADELSEYLMTEPGLRAAALALAGLVAILCAAAPAAPRRVRADWVRAAPRARVRADLDALFGRAPRARVSWAVPAAVLRDNLDRRLGAYLGCEAPLRALPEHELYRRVDHHLGRASALALARLVPLLAEIPARAHAGAPELPPVSRRAFERLHSAAQHFDRTLGIT